MGNIFSFLVIITLFFPPPDAAGSEKIYFPKSKSVISKSLKEMMDKVKDDEILTVWVFFTDKGFQGSNEYKEKISQFSSNLSDHVKKRRSKAYLDETSDFNDLDLELSYIENIKQECERIRRVSRWLNAVSVEASKEQIKIIAGFDFTRKIKLVGRFKRRPIPVITPLPPSEADKKSEQAYSIDYGQSLSQMEQINVPSLHDMGYTGNGVIVSVFDSGFLNNHEAYTSLNIIAEKDFIQNDNETSNEGTDNSTQHDHGTTVLSLIGGNVPGKLVGPAYGASYLLAKTEDVTSETSVEEDHWVAAAEWVEGLGADVISSSLAYLESNNYSYQDLDGDTAITTIAADIAISKGIVVVTANGNSGPGAGTLATPADANNIIACGAVDSSGNVASFSSRGPTYDGRIKPDLCALGVNTYAADASSSTSYGTVNGTSAATPLIAGVVALLIEIHPDWSPSQIVDAMKQSSSKSDSPDNDYGWGIVDAVSASAINTISIFSSGGFLLFVCLLLLTGTLHLRYYTQN